MGGKGAGVETHATPDIPFYGFTTAIALKLTYLRFVYILDRNLLRWVLLPIILLLMSGTAAAELKRGSSPRCGAVEKLLVGGGVSVVSTSLDLCVCCAPPSQVTSNQLQHQTLLTLLLHISICQF